MRDGQEAHQGAVLKEIQDFRLICETPEDDHNVRMKEEVQFFPLLLVKVFKVQKFNTKYTLLLIF